MARRAFSPVHLKIERVEGGRDPPSGFVSGYRFSDTVTPPKIERPFSGPRRPRPSSFPPATPMKPQEGCTWQQTPKSSWSTTASFSAWPTSALSRAGYEVSTAADGEEALKVANDILPHIIVLDMLLPKISGPDVLTALKAIPPPGTDFPK